jgi:N6-adenosine-specific RNA methylase IME4
MYLTKQVRNLPVNLEDLSKFVLVGREKLNSVRAEIRAIDKLEMAGEVREQKKEEATMLAGALLDAEVKIGELTSAIPKASGGDRKSDSFKSSTTTTFDTKQEAITKMGFDKHQISRFQQMAQNQDIVEQVKAEAKDNEDLPTRTEVLRKIKEKTREDSIQKQVRDIESGENLPEGKFEIIMMDVPWNYGTQYNPEGRRVANPYPEMSIEEIKNLDIPASENCILFFWTTQKFLRDSFEIVEHYGFDYKGAIVWDKEKIGMGEWLRMQCEFCLVAIKGKPIWQHHDIRDIIREPRREHSRKPDAIYSLIDEKLVGRKLDYFSREKREGWEVFGNDTQKF